MLAGTRTIEVLDQRGIAQRFLREGQTMQATNRVPGIRLNRVPEIRFSRNTGTRLSSTEGCRRSLLRVLRIDRSADDRGDRYGAL